MAPGGLAPARRAFLWGPGLNHVRTGRIVRGRSPGWGEEQMMDVTRGMRGEVTIRIEGTFDAKAAMRLSGWLREVPARGPLVLDFSAVRDCHDSGLAAVATDLAAREQLVVRGLNRHQERMLRYLGVDLDRPTIAAAG